MCVSLTTMTIVQTFSCVLCAHLMRTCISLGGLTAKFILLNFSLKIRCLGKIDIVVDKQRVDQSRVRLAEVEVGDETGVISLRARDDQITLLRNILDKRSGNDKSKLPAIVIRNCSVELYLGSYLRIAVSKWGKISEYPDDVASTPPPPTYINRSVDYSSMDFSLSTANLCDRKTDQIKAQVNTSAQHLSSEQYGTGASFSTDRDHTLGSVRQRGVDRRKRHTKQNNRQQNLHRGSAVMEGIHGSQYIPYHHQHPYTVGRSHFPYGHGGIIEGSNPSSLGWQMGYPDHLHHYSSMYSPPNGRADYSPYTFPSTHLRGRQDGMYQAHHYGHSMDLYQQQPPETIHHEGGDANEGAEIPKSEEKDRESTLLPAVTDSSESPKEMPPTENVGNHVSAQQHQEEVSHQYPGEIEHFPTTIHSPTQQNPLSRYFRNLRIGDPQRSSSPFSVSSTSHASAAQMDPSAATFFPRTGGWEAPSKSICGVSVRRSFSSPCLFYFYCFLLSFQDQSQVNYRVIFTQQPTLITVIITNIRILITHMLLLHKCHMAVTLPKCHHHLHLHCLTPLIQGQSKELFLDKEKHLMPSKIRPR